MTSVVLDDWTLAEDDAASYTLWIPMSEFRTIRIIHDPPLDGPTNMARDEALMEFVGDGRSPATMRLYQWDEPTVSLGYFQPFAEYQALAPPAGDLPMVRRPTGGGAILHDLELTYSLTLAIDDRLLATGPRALYGLVHDAITMALDEIGITATPSGFTDDSGAARGPFFCFARRHAADLLVGGDKIAGSAQRRTRLAILQHGSIVIGNRFAQHPVARFGDQSADRSEQVIQRLRRMIVESFAARAKMQSENGGWSADELAVAETTRAKYCSSEWTQRL